MDGEIAAHAVAGAVVEIESRGPQILPREAVELRARRAVGKHRPRQRDMALEHAGEVLAHRFTRRSDRDGAGDVGRAVFVLRAGIDQKQLARHDAPVARAGDAVMHDGTVRAGARDGRKRHVFQRAGLAPERLQRRDRVDLGELAARRLAVEPGEKSCQRRAVAPMRDACAVDLDRVLHRLHQRDRIGAAKNFSAAPGHGLGECVGGGRLVEAHFFLRRPERGEIFGEHRLLAHLVAELAAIDIERGAALARQYRERERQRRVGHVGAADVEGPGDRLRVGDDERVGLGLGDLGLHPRELRGGALAGEAQIVQHHGPKRRGRAVRPDRIDRVGVGRNQLGAGRGRGLCQFLDAGDRVKPRVVAELGAGGQVALEPSVGRRIDQVLDRKNRGVDLLARLERVAAIDEQRRAVGEHDRNTRRAGKPGEPFQPLFRRRQVFVLLLIRARQHEAAEPSPRQLGAQDGNPRGDLRARRFLHVEGLEACFEHAGTVMTGADGDNARRRLSL